MLPIRTADTKRALRLLGIQSNKKSELMLMILATAVVAEISTGTQI